MVVAVTGGLARDGGLIAALRECLAGERKGPKQPLALDAHPEAIFAGAIGAALLGARRRVQLERLGRVDAAPAS
jgi:benzoyl-CoA reductase subunit D